MLKKRKFTTNFKIKVAQELIKEEQTINQICSKYKIHTTRANRWKKEALDGLNEVFPNKSNKEVLKKIN